MDGRSLLDDNVTAQLAMAECLASQLTSPRRARVLILECLEAFTCDATELIHTFLDDLSEPEWTAEGLDRQLAAVLADLQTRLAEKGRSLADYGMDEPELIPQLPPTVDPPYLPANVQLAPGQQTLFDRMDGHLQQESPARSDFVHIEGEAGGGKTFVMVRNKSIFRFSL